MDGLSDNPTALDPPPVSLGRLRGETDAMYDVAIIDAFERWMRVERGFPRSTWGSRRNVVERFASWLRVKRRRPLLRCDVAAIRMFLSEYHNPRTRNRVLADLRSFYVFAVEGGHCKSNPTGGVYRAREPRALPRPLGADNRKLLFRACRKVSLRSYTVAATMGYAGLRVSECANLRKPDLDFGLGRVRVVHGKGDKERYVPMNPALFAALKAWLSVQSDDCDYVFPGQYRTRPITTVTLWTDIKTAASVAGIYCTPHMLRHTFGTETYRATRDAFLVARMMGHSSPVVTFRYAEVVGDDMDAAVRSLDFEGE